MMDTTRRRFLTILGVGAAGTILPAGYSGATGAIIQAVEDPVTRSINMARGIAEYVAEARARGVVYLLRDEKVWPVVNEKMEELFTYMDREFPGMPAQEHVSALFRERNSGLVNLSTAEAKSLSFDVTPIAIFKNLISKQQTPFDTARSPGFNRFASRYRSMIVVVDHEDVALEQGASA